MLHASFTPCSCRVAGLVSPGLDGIELDEDETFRVALLWRQIPKPCHPQKASREVSDAFLWIDYKERLLELNDLTCLHKKME